MNLGASANKENFITGQPLFVSNETARDSKITNILYIYESNRQPFTEGYICPINARRQYFPVIRDSVLRAVYWDDLVSKASAFYCMILANQRNLSKSWLI